MPSDHISASGPEYFFLMITSVIYKSLFKKHFSFQ
jgi:hypothetical protein